MDAFVREKLTDLATRSERERKRFYARRPKQVGALVTSVIAKQGYAAAKSATALEATWNQVAEQVLGEPSVAKQTKAAGLKRGVLEVLVANHVVMQEINFVRPGLTAAMQEALPKAKIRSLRFKVGRVR